MKTLYKTIAIVLIGFTLTSCGEEQKPREKYCGIEMSGFEVMDLKSLRNKGYEHTTEDKELAGDMMDAVKSISDNEYEAKFSFFMRDENAIGLYIVAPNDSAAVEKISCLLLEEDFNGRLPKQRKLLFYTDEHETILAAIKTKKETTE